MMPSIYVDSKLSSYLEERWDVKHQIHSFINQTYNRGDIGGELSNYAGEIDKLYGNAVLRQGAAEALYAMPSDRVGTQLTGSGGIYRSQISGYNGDGRTNPEMFLATEICSRRNVGKTISFPEIVELSVDSLAKFSFWFTGISASIVEFPNMTKLYVNDFDGTPQTSPNALGWALLFNALSCVAPKLKYISDPFFEQLKYTPQAIGVYSNLFIDANELSSTEDRNIDYKEYNNRSLICRKA